MGELIVLAIKVVLYKLANLWDPDMVKMREVKRIRHAKEKDREEIDKALIDGDTASLSVIWARLQPHPSPGTE